MVGPRRSRNRRTKKRLSKRKSGGYSAPSTIRTKKGGTSSIKDVAGQVVSPYYLYQRRIKKKSPEKAEKATVEVAKKAIIGGGDNGSTEDE